ncbi:DUF1893 domain-containing protein [Chloroflexota bacterium]
MKKTEDKQLEKETSLFRDFVASSDTLRVYDGDKLLFASDKDRLKPLLEYLDKDIPHQGEIKIFDTILGNAAALLAVRAGCRKAYSPLSSELAIKTLNDYSIEYSFTEIVPYIQNREGQGMCPMESLSIGKSPEEFYAAVQRPGRDN